MIKMTDKDDDDNIDDDNDWHQCNDDKNGYIKDCSCVDGHCFICYANNPVRFPGIDHVLTW